MEGHAKVGKRKALRVECDICDKDLASPSLRSQLETQHGIYRSFVLSRDLVDEDCLPVSYRATNYIATRKSACPVSGCVGTAGTKYGIRQQFRILHPQDLLHVQGGRLLPQVRPLRDAGEPDGHGSPGHEDVQGHARC